MKTLALSTDLVTIFCLFDDLVALLELKTNNGRPNSLSVAEIAVISLLRSRYNITTWKGTYKMLQDKYSDEFKLPCYKK